MMNRQFRNTNYYEFIQFLRMCSDLQLYRNLFNNHIVMVMK